MVLDAEIREAQAAAAAVAELEVTQEKAKALPALLEQRDKAQRQEEARAQLHHARQTAKGLLDEAAPALGSWRERYEAVILELDSLISSLPELEGHIFEAMRVLARADTAVSEANAPSDYYTAEAMQERAQAQTVPDALRAGPRDLSKVWAEIGGLNAALDALNPNEHPASLAAELNLMVQRRTRGTTVFHTAMAGRLLMRFG